MARKKRPKHLLSKNGRVMSHSPRVWGYARVSTDDQDMSLQIAALERYGVDGIFKEKKSGKNLKRPELQKMLSELYLRGNDTVVVWKTDRLGRSLPDLIETVQHIEDSGARFVSLTDNIDTSTATGRFFFHIIAAMAEWERNMISERTRAGMEQARAEGRKLGPPHLIRDNKKRLAHMRKLDQKGLIRDEKGQKVMLDRDLMDELNKGDPEKPIKSIVTVRRWRTEGYPGLDED